MAQKLVIITLTLWLLFLMFAIGVARIPEIALLPLYGLYPGSISSGDSGYNPKWGTYWAIAMGVSFFILAFIALWRKSTIAGITLLILFILSTGVSCARVMQSFQGLH